MTRHALNYDYEIIKKALEESKINRSKNTSSSAIKYDFTEFTDPVIILHLSTTQKEEKSEMTPLNLNGELSSKQAKQNLNFQSMTQNYHSMQTPPTIIIQNSIQEKYLKFNWNNSHCENNNSNNNIYQYSNNAIENHSSTMQNNQETPSLQKNIYNKDLENEINQRLQETLEMEKQKQKKEIDNILEEKFKEWEEANKSKEMENKIKHKDALLQEMFEKIQVEDNKIQMLVKIRELDDENTILKQVIETRCPNYDLYIEKENEEDEENLYDNQLIDDEERKKNIEIIKAQELENKKKRDEEFYKLSQITQNAYSSITEESNQYELEMKLNADLW